MTNASRVVGLIIVCAVITCVQLLLFKPFWVVLRDRFGNDDMDMVSTDASFLMGRAPSFRGKQTDGAEKSLNQDKEFFAPIIIGAGQGTTGTHLFAEVTCQLGFVSLHHGIGCVPSNAISVKQVSQQISIGNASDIINATEQRESTCPIEIDHFQDPYITLLDYHKSICHMFLKMGKNDKDPLDFMKEILQHLERIIMWGKEHKVALALHDAPYPLLMPDILKLVAKHYRSSSEELPAKPIILLSERDPQKYAEKRIRGHGIYSWICQSTKEQMGTNSSNTISIEMMNATTLEGGAFDIIGCINRVTNQDNEAHSQIPQMKEIFYSMKQADKLQHRQFIIDTMENYQEVVRGSAIFSYNMFEKEGRTSASDLAAQIRQTMVDALLVKANGSYKLRMRNGYDFRGFDNFFASIERPAAGGEERTSHRRRHHGDRYDEASSQNSDRTATLDELIATDAITSNHTKLIPVHIYKKQVIPSLDGSIKCNSTAQR